MTSIQIPFGFEADVTTLFEGKDYHSPITGYRARVTLVGVEVFSRTYPAQTKRIEAFEAKHGRPNYGQQHSATDREAYYAERGKFLKGSVLDDVDAKDEVMTDFAYRLALTLTMPDGE